MEARIKRVYEAAAKSDGTRILVDRLWPRGLRKADAHIDLWLKEIAPTPELRAWFDHDPAKFPLFRDRYRAELHARPEEINAIKEYAATGPVTLVYSAKDEQHNQAVVLQAFLRRR
ncbi:MAG TPA: DUF488 domain-containing protein [Edaphobacter sp.]|jgi:uncharacterized protein YeaO (DUF488 family)|nr:DUF488 domain-containing protein [Edaphobacter sp.]